MTGIHNESSRAGFTLVETMISIGIFMILVTIAVGGFVQAIHTQGEVSKLISAQSNVSLGIEEMAREIRTGYLFCHDPGSNNPTSSCETVRKTCSITDSGFSDPGGPGALGNGDLPVWTCPTLQFYNANSELVNYSLSSDGALVRSDVAENSGQALPLTSGDVVVKTLQFRLFGMLEGDGWTPRITVLLSIAPSSTDPAIANTVLNFETTISARQIDCTPSGQC